MNAGRLGARRVPPRMHLKRFRLIVGDTELHFDTDYGMDRRSGWSVVIECCVLVQFVSFWTALRTFVGSFRRREA